MMSANKLEREKPSYAEMHTCKVQKNTPSFKSGKNQFSGA